jgi:4-hydroxy-tetrahydrodipicolinate synthase
MPEQFSERLHGIIPPVTTPLTEAGAFDPESAKNLYRYMLESGVHGLFLFGSSGEGPVINDDERTFAMQTAVEVVQSRIPLLVGVLFPGTKQVITHGRLAKQLGADALVVAPPFYFPATQDELLDHFRAVRTEVELPIIAYDIPATTKIKVELNTMLQLAREGTVVGVKDSSGDVAGFRRLLAKRPPGFKMFTGSELLIDAVLLMGADGAVPGLANVAPELFVQLYDHWKAGRQAEAVEIQRRIVQLFEALVPPDNALTAAYAIGFMKAAQKLRGVIASTRSSLPLTQFTTEQEERTRRILIEFGLL